MSTTLPVRRLIGLALIFSLGSSALVRADDDATKRRDRQPPVKAPAIRGRPIHADEWKVSRRAGGSGGGVAGGFTAKNMTLLSWLPLNALPGNSTSAADCWGYTSPTGREYAIIGISEGTAFVEVTDPVNPVVVGFVQGASSEWHDATVIGDYCYACSDVSGGYGVQIIDLRQIDSGVVTLVKNWMPNGLVTIHTIISNPETKHLFLDGANIANGGLICVDASDPENLVMKGAWTDQYMHECQPVLYKEGPYAGRELVFGFSAGPYYGYSKGFAVIDVTDMSNPVGLSLVAYPDIQFCHQGWVTPDLQHLYINDELDNLNRTRIYDISDPGTPVYKGYFTQATGSIDHNLYVKDGKIYEGNYTSGLRIFDMADPLAPVETAFFDTHPEGDAATFNGDWGNYPFFKSGTLIASDLERGLFVLKEEVGQLLFAFPNGLPGHLQPGATTPIDTTITEDQITLDPSTVRLIAAVNGVWAYDLPMTPDGQGGFIADLPAADCLDVESWYISAAATDGRVFTSPAGAPDDAYSAKAYTNLLVMVDDAMETDTGWISGAPDDNATTGKWNRMDPYGNGAQPEDDHTPDGTVCWVTDGGPGDLGFNDVDGGKTTLLSPVYDLSAHPDATFGYWRWYSNSAGAEPFADVFRVDISNDGGAHWTNAETVGPDGPEVSGGWFYHEFRIADFLAPTAAVQLRFIAEDANGGSVIEAAVDDFSAVEYQCQTCRPDLNADGTLDLFDFLTFTNLFNAGDPSADFDGNGVFDLFDFLAFVNAFNAGC